MILENEMSVLFVLREAVQKYAAGLLKLSHA